MADTTTTESIVLLTPNQEAKIILDWDDGQWYISDIQSTGTSSSSSSSSTSATDTAGVKVPEWDTSYKYSENDIVAFGGTLYVSKQNVNQGNSPASGTFWWYPIVDLSTVDAITLEGKNLNEIIRAVLGGNVITDYYKKSEVDNIILTYFNNVNAKKLNDWTLQNIKDDYNALITSAETRANDYAVDYVTNDRLTGLDQSLVDTFNETIAPDTVNQLS